MIGCTVSVSKGQELVLMEVNVLQGNKIWGEWIKIQKKNHINSYQQNTLFLGRDNLGFFS
jgi:hypothetical protein